LKEEALERTMWRARFGRGFGPVVRQTTERMNEVEHLVEALHYKSTRVRFPMGSIVFFIDLILAVTIWTWVLHSL
jgi:hypothetical protein